MNDVEREVAIEWANKILSSRVSVTAGCSEQLERWQDWRVNQRKCLDHFATTAAETFIRRSQSPFDPPTKLTAPDAELIAKMRVSIAREVAAASKAQASLDESIALELSSAT